MRALLWILLAGLSCAQEQSIEALWQAAVQAHQQGDLDAALAKYEQVLKSQPAFVPALSNAGAVLSKLGRFEDAAIRYRKALKAGGDHPGIRLNLALAYYNQARLDDAIGELRKIHPASPQATLLLADCYLRTGDNKGVIALLESQEQSDDRAVNYLLGAALIRDDQVARGQKIIDRVFRDESPEGLMMIGAAQYAAQENRKSMETLARAIAKNPKLPGLYSLYGKAQLTDGSPGSAREAFLKELAHNPSDYDANLYLGTLYRMDKEFDQAKKYLDKARQIRPAALELKYQIASLELSLGNTAVATGMLEEVVKAAPKFVEGHITLATAYYRLKRKADGDRERGIVEQLNSEMQSKELRTR